MGHDIKGNRLDVKIIRNTDYVAGEGQDGFQGSRIRALNRIEYPVAWNDLGDLDLVYKKYVLDLFADIDDSGIAEVFFDDETAIKEIESYSDGVSVVDISNGKIYRFDFNATVGLQPDNNPDPEGRWVEVGQLGGSSEVVTVQNAEVYDPTKIYEGGNVFVSFVNLSSPDPMFQTEALYRSSKTTAAGISPEDDLQDSGSPTGKWVYQGQFAIIQDGGLAKIFYADEAEIQAITGYKDGNNAVNLTDGKIYEYDFFALSGIKPNDHTYPEGRWTEVGVIGGGGHIILDNEENVMPTQPALQFGAGFTVTDEVDKTVVERDIIDFGDIIPDPTKGKKLAKVKDDGTGLDYTDYGYDEVVQKAQTFNEGTLKKFDVNGNDVDSGLTGESLDIYAISSSLINALTNESNWRDGGGNPIVGGVAFASGIKGQRYYSDEFFYECIADNSWVRTYTGRPVINIYDNPALTLVFKGYLEDTLNWVGKIYVGTAITGVAQGTRHYDNDYVYEFFQTNVPIRYSRD